MAKKELTVEQRKLDVDLWTIAFISFAVLGIYMVLQNQFVAVVKDSGTISFCVCFWVPHFNLAWRD